MTNTQKVVVLRKLRELTELQLIKKYEADRNGICDLLYIACANIVPTVTPQALGIYKPNPNKGFNTKDIEIEGGILQSFCFWWPRTDAGYRMRIEAIDRALENIPIKNNPLIAKSNHGVQLDIAIEYANPPQP